MVQQGTLLEVPLGVHGEGEAVSDDPDVVISSRNDFPGWVVLLLGSITTSSSLIEMGTLKPISPTLFVGGMGLNILFSFQVGDGSDVTSRIGDVFLRFCSATVLNTRIVAKYNFA